MFIPAILIKDIRVNECDIIGFWYSFTDIFEWEWSVHVNLIYFWYDPWYFFHWYTQYLDSELSWYILYADRLPEDINYISPFHPISTEF